MENQWTFPKVAEVLKAVLGLSGLAYLSGFVVVTAQFLSWGVTEVDLYSARTIAAGAIFLFLVFPVTVFPYLRGLHSFNTSYKTVVNAHLSEDLYHFYENNRQLIERSFGSFVVVLITLVIVSYVSWRQPREEAGGLWRMVFVFTLWYLGSYLFSRLAVILFNLRFFWRIKMLQGGSPFWENFTTSFQKSYISSFTKSHELVAGQKPTTEEIERELKKFVLKGISPQGFLGSALYKGIALFFLCAVTFGWFLYPLLPASIGGGKPKTIVLLISAEKSTGLARGVGLPGEHIKLESKPGEVERVQLLTPPLQLLARTSDAYFLLVPRERGMTVVKVPGGSVEAVSYSRERKILSQ